MEPTFTFFLTEEAKKIGINFSSPRQGDAGFDIRCLKVVSIAPGEKTLIETGLHLAIPQGFVGIVRDRSSVAVKGGLTAAGVIDSSYRGEVKILMHNTTKAPLTFEAGEKIAQLVVLQHLTGNALEAAPTLDDLGSTERASGGFGSTGKR